MDLAKLCAAENLVQPCSRAAAAAAAGRCCEVASNVTGASSHNAYEAILGYETTFPVRRRATPSRGYIEYKSEEQSDRKSRMIIIIFISVIRSEFSRSRKRISLVES